MFTVKADFNLPPYELPNLDGNNTFLAWVDVQEEKILKSLLGKTLYDSFVEGLDTDYPDDVWINLRDGAYYILGGKTYGWVGMKKMLTPYIYSEWIRANFTRFTGVGAVRKKGENVVVVNPRQQIADSWMDFYEVVGNECSEKNTLYGYLSVNGQGGYFDEFFDDYFDTFMEYFRFEFNDPGRMNKMNI